MDLSVTKFFVLILPVFFAVMVFYVERSHATRGPLSSRADPSLVSRVFEQSRAALAERMAVKKQPRADDNTALSEAVRTSIRNLPPNEKRVQSVLRQFHAVSLPRLLLAPKISTNLFLSVLNL
jgi:hypothetical protein